jgi:hypothetical protein
MDLQSLSADDSTVPVAIATGEEVLGKVMLSILDTLRTI